MKYLLLASLALTATAFIGAFLLHRLRIQSPLLHRAVWICVLVQGILIFGLPIKLSILPPQGDTALSGDHELAVLFEPRPFSPEATVDTGPGNSPATRVEGNPTNSLHLWHHAYIAGISLCFLYLLSTYVALLISVRRARPAPAEWLEQWTKLLTNHDLAHRRIDLLVHPRMGPLLCRLPGRYAVILPEQTWLQLSAEQREAVLEHEIAHVQRKDIWKTFAARVLAMIHWFNPIAWWSARQFEEAAEWDCDQRLAKRGKTFVRHYAGALLALAAPSRFTPVGVSLARGAAISPRIRRLTRAPGKDSRCAVLTIVATVVIASALSICRFELVAQESREDSSHEELKSELNHLVDRIDGSGETVRQFKAMLREPAGRIVMKELITETREEKLEELAATALEAHFREHFESGSGGAYLLRETSRDYRERLIQTVLTYETDINAIASEMESLRQQLSGKSEAGKLMCRFMEQEGAAHLLYFEQIREAIHPGQEQLEEKLGRILVRDGDGKLRVPQSRIREARKAIETGQRVLELASVARREFPLLADEIAGVDQDHAWARQILSNPGFADFFAAELGEETLDDPLAASVDELFEHIEGGFVDRSDGIHLNPEERDEVLEVFSHYEMIQSGISQTRDLLEKYLEDMALDDLLHRDLHEVLSSPTASILIGRDFVVTERDPGYAFREITGEIISFDEDGRWEVKKSSQEEVSEIMKDALRDLRFRQRKGRQLLAEGELIEDQELSSIYSSFTGQMVVIEIIRERIERSSADGLQLWVENHFETDETGRLKPRGESIEFLSEIVAASLEIASNLKSDF